MQFPGKERGGATHCSRGPPPLSGLPATQARNAFLDRTRAGWECGFTRASLNVIITSLKNGAHSLVMASKIFNVPTVPGHPGLWCHWYPSRSSWLPGVQTLLPPHSPQFWKMSPLPPLRPSSPQSSSWTRALPYMVPPFSPSTSIVITASERSVSEPLSPPKPPSLVKPLPMGPTLCSLNPGYCTFRNSMVHSDCLALPLIAYEL